MACCCFLIFPMPWRVESDFYFPKLTPGGVGEPLPRTLSQMRVSRDQNFINFCFKMSICANSLWNSCNSGINIEAHSLGSQQLAGHSPMRLPIEADLDPFKTQVLEYLCPRFVKTFSQITSPRACVRSRVINLSQQSKWFAYLEIIHVLDQLRSSQIIVTYHVSYIIII